MVRSVISRHVNRIRKSVNLEATLGLRQKLVEPITQGQEGSQGRKERSVLSQTHDSDLQVGPLPDADIVVLFGGYGSSLDGRLDELRGNSDARRMIDMASDRLKVNIDAFYSNPNKLYEQPINIVEPVLFVNNLACSKVRDIDKSSRIRAGGFGVGELSALVFSGWLPFDEALRICISRSNAIDDSSVRRDGRQVIVRQNRKSDLKKAIREGKQFCEWKNMKPDDIVCSVAAYLYPECKIVAGSTPAIQFIAHNFNHYGLSSVRYLQTPCALNTSLIRPMRFICRDMAAQSQKEKSITCFSSLSGTPFRDWLDVRQSLIYQATKPIRWEQLLYNIYLSAEHRDHVARTVFPVHGERDHQNMLRLANHVAYRAWAKQEMPEPMLSVEQMGPN